MIQLQDYIMNCQKHFDECNDFSDHTRSKMEPKYDPTNFALDEYDYSEQYKKSTAELVDLSPLEDHKEVKEAKGLKILTPNKLLARLPMLLAQIKAGNNSNKLRNEIRQVRYYCINMIKSPRNFIKV